jgi:ACS family hexuronate transporter-like MFS transporter
MNEMIPKVVEMYGYTPVFGVIALFVPLSVGAIYVFAKKIKSVE